MVRHASYHRLSLAESLYLPLPLYNEFEYSWMYFHTPDSLP